MSNRYKSNIIVKMKKKITQFDGLYGDINHKPKHNYIFLELIKTRSEGFDWTIKPHLHTQLYQFFFIESGNATFASSVQSQTIKTPALLIIPPNTLHGFHYSNDVNGKILTISDTVFNWLFPASASLSLEFETLKYLNLSQVAFKQIQLVLNEINEELFSNKLDKKIMIDSLLRQLFISIYRHIQNTDLSISKDTNTTLQHYRKFIQLIKKYDQPKSIPAFAKEIGITTVHLNRICNQICGKSALLIIQEHLIEQSKNYLLHSNHTIAEIAYLLNFEYPNYFARLFKKLNGISPKEYRCKN